MEEIWKDVPGYEGLYQVSNVGNVFSIKRNIIMSKQIDKQGYFKLNLNKKGFKKRFQIQQLVAMAFLNHIPCGHKIVVDHINDNPLDNRVQNLQLLTNVENLHKGGSKEFIGGIYWHKNRNKWQVLVNKNGNKKHIGIFNSKEDAEICFNNYYNGE